MNKNTATIVISGLIGLLIGALGTWAYMGGGESRLERAERDINALINATGTEETNENPSATNPNEASGTNNQNTSTRGETNPTMTEMSLVIQDQSAGDMVRIESVRASEAAWIVISEDVNGNPGRILGARLYEPRIGVQDVPLLRSTVAGKAYHAQFYADTNGDRLFDHRTDTKVAGQSGSVVFRAQ